jgi:transcription antitermination factor NusG
MMEEPHSAQPARGVETSATLPAAQAVNHQVRIIAGELRGIEGTVIQRPHERQLLLALPCFGRGVYVQIDPRAVESI